MTYRELGERIETQESLSNQELVPLIESIFSDIKKVKWTNERIQKELGRRSVQSIMESGETCYMGSCVDMTLSLLAKMKSSISPDKLSVGCELLRWKETGNYGFHLFLKDYSVSPIRVIDFVRKNEVEVYYGNYSNPLNHTALDQLALYELSAQEIDNKDSFLSLVEKMNISLPPELFQAYLSKLQHDNTDEQFENFQANSPQNIKIHPSLSQQTNEDIHSALISDKSL